MKHSKFIAILVLSVMMFGVIQPAFAYDNRTSGEVAADTAGGAVIGGLLGAAVVFFTGGAALPFVLGGAAIGAAVGASDEETRKNIAAGTVSGVATGIILNQMQQQSPQSQP